MLSDNIKNKNAHVIFLIAIFSEFLKSEKILAVCVFVSPQRPMISNYKDLGFLMAMMANWKSNSDSRKLFIKRYI